MGVTTTPRQHMALIRVLDQMGLSDTLLASLLIQMSRDILRAKVVAKPVKTKGENDK